MANNYSPNSSSTFASKSDKFWKSNSNSNNFWQSRKSSYSTSDYWLKDSIFDRRKTSFFDEPKSVEVEYKYDHFQLAQYQRAISNFVRILTGRNDITVRYNNGGNNYTDGKTITLSPNIKEKEFDTAVGLALHEGSHILYSDFDALNTAVSSFYGTGDDYESVNRKKLFINIVEDLYIDAMTYRSAPGYRGYYQSLYQKYFGDKKIEEGLWSQDYADPTWNNYLFHLVNIRNPKRNIKALPGLETIFNMLSLPNITRLSTAKSRIDLAMEIYDECSKYIDAIKELAQSMLGPDMGTADGANTGEINYPELNEMLERMAEANGDGDGDINLDSDKFVASNGVNIQEEMEDTNRIDLDKLSDKAKAALEKMFETQRNFVNGQARKGKLSDKEQQKINALVEVDVEKKIVGNNGMFGKAGIPLYIIRQISEKFIEAVGHRYGLSGYASGYRIDTIEDGIAKGKLLAKKLQLRNEERIMKTTRLDSGKIDKRLLHEIGFDNFDIFSKINITSYKPTFIHISLDQSGSMYSNWNECMRFVTMFATASKYINNIHLMVSIRSSYTDSSSGRNEKQLPYLITIFDSKKDNVNHIRKFFPKIEANALTPEGLAFDGIMKETIQHSQNKEAYFINICDGEPWFYYSRGVGSTFTYNGEQARKHSREQMKRMESAGIKFITYFIGSKYSFDPVKECYGNNSIQLDSGSDIQTVTKSMNKKLLAV